MDFTSTPSQFIFPVLKSADILLCMTELEIDLTKAELSEPHRHKDKIKKVFMALVRIIQYTDTDQIICIPVLLVVHCIHYIHLYRENLIFFFFSFLTKTKPKKISGYI